MSTRSEDLTLAQVGEAGFVKLLRRRFARPAPGVVLGVGDDAAVLHALGPQAVVSTDMLIENVDFARRWATPGDIGHKAAAVNLSDLAAMGATPRALVASLALHAHDRVTDVMQLLTRLDQVGRRFGAPLVGGDLSRIDGPWVISVTAMGVASTRGVLRRGLGQPGDALLVSGTLGAAALGLRQLQQGATQANMWTRRQLRPTPQVALGCALARCGRVRSAADISDGLSQDVLHVVAPGCGAVVDAAVLPVARGFWAAAAKLTHSPLDLVLSGGEDFELVLAVAPQHVAFLQGLARRHRTQLRQVGTVTAKKGLKVLNSPFLADSTGFDHFGSNV